MYFLTFNVFVPRGKWNLHQKDANLTLNVPYISESSIEIKNLVIFLFSYFFVVPQKVLWRPLS